MVKRLLLLSAVAFALVSCCVGTRCFAEAADVSAQFKQADEYEEDGKYKDAEAIYKGIAKAYAGKDDGLRAQQKLVCLYIERGRTGEAETAYQELLAGYAGYGDDNVIADAVDDVADAYRDVKKYDKALEIYRYVVDTWPGSKQAVGSHGGIARVNIKLGREEAAQAALKKLIGSFSSNGNIADVVDGVADEYREVKKYEKALQFYKHVVDSWPESEQAIGSQGCIVRINIELGDDPNAKVAVDKLIADFANRDGIADVVDGVADEYREVKKYEKALQFYKHVVDSWPDSAQAMGSQAEVAKLYIELGDDPNAKAAVDKLIADFAGRDEIADVVDDVADEYREVKKYEKALQLYKYIVDSWPKSEQAVGSQVSIAKLNIERGDDPNAEAAVDKLIADFSDNNDIAEVIDHIADVYREEKKYKKARELYQDAVNRWPKAEHVANSLSGVVRTSLLLGDDSNAEASTEELLTRFADHREMAEIVHQLADDYRELRRYEKARELYQHVVDNWPGSACAAECQAGVARSYILLEDDPNAQAAIDALTTKFLGNSDLQHALSEIAKEYEDRGRYFDAKGLYQQITEDAEMADGNEPELNTKTAQILFYINDGNDTAAFEAIDQLIIDYNKHPDLAKTVFEIGKKYYDMGRQYKKAADDQGYAPNSPQEMKAMDYFERTLAVAQEIITGIPEADADVTVEAVHLAAECCRRLGRHGTAQGYYQTVVDNWPEYKYAARSLSLVADCYVYLRSTGAIEKAEANAQIEAAYRRLLDQYPDYGGSQIAHKWLTWLDDQKQLEEGEKK